MLANNPTFKGLLKVHQIPTNSNPRPYENQNFQEFRTVYGENKHSSKCSHKTQESVRPKTELKTIQLEMPLLGSEKAIIPVAVLKKNAVTKSVLRKTPTSPTKVATTKDLLKKLTKMEKEQTNKKMTPKVLKTPSLNIIDKTNQEIDLAADQLKQIREMIQNKKEGKPKRQNSPIYKLKKKNSPRFRHLDCFNAKYCSTLTSLKQKVTSLEEKYFSKPQIVYRSIHDNFTQSSDLKILYENKAYPEDLKMDQALRGIIDELDDMVNGNIEKEILDTLEPKDGDSVPAFLKRSKSVKTHDFPKNLKSSNKSLIQGCNTFVDKTELSTKLDHLFKFGRKSLANNSLGVKKTKIKEESELDDIRDGCDNKRNYVPRNISFRKLGVGSSTSLDSTKSDNGNPAQRVRKKVTFVDTIAENTSLNIEQTKNKHSTRSTLSQGQSECERLVDKMYQDSLCSFGEPLVKEDSIFALVDDTKMQIDEFLKLKEEMTERMDNGKFLFQNTINDMNEFVKSKRIFDERKEVVNKLDSEVQEIINRAKHFRVLEESNEEPNSKGSFEDSGTGVTVQDSTLEKEKLSERHQPETKEDGIHTEDNICNLIDSSEALIKKFRNIKGNIFAVGEFCDNLSRITESEEDEDESKPIARPVPFHDGSGDEGDSIEIEEEDLPNSLKKSSFLMREFKILPKVKFFSHSEKVLRKSNKISESGCTTKQGCGMDLQNLTNKVNNALEDSFFSTLEY